MDRPGCITEVSAALSSREDKCGDDAGVPSEKRRRGCGDGRGAADEPIPVAVTEELRKKEDILEAISLNLETGTAGSRGQIRKFMRRDSESFCQQFM